MVIIVSSVTFLGAVIKCSNKNKLGKVSFGQEVKLSQFDMAQKEVSPGVTCDSLPHCIYSQKTAMCGHDYRAFSLLYSLE